jgi:hypothetical protein
LSDFCLTVAKKDKMEILTYLINRARGMLESGFGIQVFQGWESLAFLALLTSFGPFHFYTQSFRRLTSERNQQALLAGLGLLIAAKENLSQQYALKADQMSSSSHIRAQYSDLLDRV